MKAIYFVNLQVDGKNKHLLKSIDSFTNRHVNYKFGYGNKFEFLNSADFNEAVKVIEKDCIEYELRYKIVPDKICEFPACLIGFPTSNSLFNNDNKLDKVVIAILKWFIRHGIINYKQTI